jgi:hypothetical protein
MATHDSPTPADDVTKLDAGPGQVSYRAEVDAPVTELFAIVADPHRHGDLDGSGTVQDTVSGPDRLSPGAKFSVKMRLHGLPYRITSRVTEFAENSVVEWQHPAGHRWRWEFVALDADRTEVTETFDYRHGRMGRRAYELFKFPATNANGIKATLAKLRARYAS